MVKRQPSSGGQTKREAAPRNAIMEDASAVETPPMEALPELSGDSQALAPAPAAPPVVGATAPPARPRCTGPICRENMNLYGIQGRTMRELAHLNTNVLFVALCQSGSQW